MHGRSLDDPQAPAALTPEKLASLFSNQELREDNVIELDTKKRRAA